MTKDNYLKKFGKHLRTLRRDKKISLREMELRGDISRQILSNIETGKRNPTLYSIKKICEALEITEAELFKNL